MKITIETGSQFDIKDMLYLMHCSIRGAKQKCGAHNVPEYLRARKLAKDVIDQLHKLEAENG
jgi:hypothetical protein